MQKSGGCVQRCGYVKTSPPSDPGRSPIREPALLKIASMASKRKQLMERKRGQDSFWGLPRGRTVLCNSRLAALRVAQPSSPNAQLRRMQFRNPCNPASACGSFTHRSHGCGSAGSRGATSQHGASPAAPKPNATATAPHAPPTAPAPDSARRTAAPSADARRTGVEKGTGPICRNGPEGAAHKLDLSPFFHRTDVEGRTRAP